MGCSSSSQTSSPKDKEEKSPATGSTDTQVAPAPAPPVQKLPEGTKATDGPNPFFQLGYLSVEKLNELREVFDEHKGPDEFIAVNEPTFDNVDLARIIHSVNSGDWSYDYIGGLLDDFNVPY